MALTAASLTTGSSTTNDTAYATASITPAADRLVLVGILVTGTNPTPALTLTGCGLTWVQVTQTTAGARTAHLFRALGSPTAGAVTITAATGITSCLWQVAEFAGVDTSGTNGSGAIVQIVDSRPGSATSASVAFPSPVTSGNATYGVVGLSIEQAPSAGAGWTSAGTTTQTAPTSGLLGEYALTAQQDVTAMWTSSANAFVLGAEIKAAPAGGSTLDAMRLGAGTMGLRIGSSAVDKAYLGATQVWP